MKTNIILHRNNLNNKPREIRVNHRLQHKLFKKKTLTMRPEFMTVLPNVRWTLLLVSLVYHGMIHKRWRIVKINTFILYFPFNLIIFVDDIVPRLSKARSTF